MAADHYLNKVFIYILPVKTTIPHQPFPETLYKVIYSRPRVALPSAAGSATGGREQHERRPRADDFFLADG